MNNAITKTTTKTILIVDDDKSINAILNFILQQAGFNTLTSSSGKECIKISQSTKHIDLIFLDLQMPEMSGIETLKKLQKTSSNLPIVMMTGHAETSLLKDVFNLGAYGIIYKPFDVEEVLSIIDTIFSTASPKRI